MTSTVIAQTVTATGTKAVSDSHLRTAQRVFGHLTCDPQPVLVLDCDALTTLRRLPAGTLPRGVRSLAELRDWMIEHPRAYLARDVIWREVVVRARAGEQGWTTGAVGLAMPALVRSARHYATGYTGDAADIANEVLLGFLEALKDPAIDVEKPALIVKMYWSSWRAGRAARLGLRNQRDHETAIGDDEEPTPKGGGKPKSSAPRDPWQHTDLLVHRAATLGYLDHTDVDAWIDTRLGGHAVAVVAAERREPADALRMRLRRADAAIAVAIDNGLLASDLSVTVAQRAGDANQRPSRAVTVTELATRRRTAAPTPALALAA
ncbi:hypothetical protein [Longispora albida]|uniref:hypothetical protein n=1 Tax=Longispora albida TaxID=203523 RepID=UPI0003821BCE|nr:hypothetical protein [Longispora albida]